MMQVDVIDAPASVPVIISVTKDSGDDFWVVQVRGDSSTSDDRDEIVEWNWDFGGLAFSTVQGSVAVPLVIPIRQGGPLQIRLTVTTAFPLEAEGTVDVILE